MDIFRAEKLKSMQKKQVYVETYGCQMNVADSEVVLSIMNDGGFGITQSPDNADVIFVNTCSVKWDNAEQRVRQRISTLKNYKRKNPGVLIGVLGCMAERLRTELIDKGNVVDMVVGPDEDPKAAGSGGRCFQRAERNCRKTLAHRKLRRYYAAANGRRRCLDFRHAGL